MSSDGDVPVINNDILTGCTIRRSMSQISFLFADCSELHPEELEVLERNRDGAQNNLILPGFCKLLPSPQRLAIEDPQTQT